MIQQPDAGSLAALTAVSVACTQILKDLGVQGEINKVVCIGFSMVIGYLMLFQPALFSVLILPLAGVTGTGGVSLIGELLTKFGAPQKGQSAA